MVSAIALPFSVRPFVVERGRKEEARDGFDETLPPPFVSAAKDKFHNVLIFTFSTHEKTLISLCGFVDKPTGIGC